MPTAAPGDVKVDQHRRCGRTQDRRARRCEQCAAGVTATAPQRKHLNATRPDGRAPAFRRRRGSQSRRLRRRAARLLRVNLAFAGRRPSQCIQHDWQLRVQRQDQPRNVPPSHILRLAYQRDQRCTRLPQRGAVTRVEAMQVLVDQRDVGLPALDVFQQLSRGLAAGHHAQAPVFQPQAAQASLLCPAQADQ